MATVRALELHVDPRRSRWTVALLLLGALALIWGGALISLRQQRLLSEAEFLEKMHHDALMLEEHASRTLDTVVARLTSLAALVTPEALAGDRLSSDLLASLIRDDKVLRSLSLLDEDGVVLISSSPANMGARVPPLSLPGMGDLRSEGIAWGGAWPQRDLADFAQPQGSARPGARSWLAASEVQSGEARYRVVAVINLGIFENLWARVDTDEAHELALFDLRGQRLVTHHGFLRNDNELRAAFESKALSDPVGRLELSGGLPVEYRVSARHPVILSVIGNLGILAEERAEDRMRLLIAAGVASGVVVLVLGLLFRGYLRYEASVIEMTNQARAIGAHLMLSESTPEGNITYVNEAYLKVSGYELGEVIGRNHRLFKSGIHPQSYYEALWKTVLAGRIWKGSFRNRRKDGSVFWVNATIIPYLDAWGQVKRFVAFYTDISDSMALTRQITEERRQRQKLAELNRQLVSEALTDPLTQVANRRGFERFCKQITAPGRLPQPLAVVMLDLDHFKQVNDRHGHAAGDEVLREVTHRWSRTVRDSDLLARLGGEEFCVLLPGSEFEGAQAVAEKLRQAVASAPVALTRSEAAGGGTQSLPVTVSVGVAWTPDARGLDLEALQHQADEALYDSKRGGRDRVTARRSALAPEVLVEAEPAADDVSRF